MDGRRRMAGRVANMQRDERETDVTNSGCCATIEHGLRQLAAARGEKSELLNAEGQILVSLNGNHVDSATIQYGIANWTNVRLMSFFYQR